MMKLDNRKVFSAGSFVMDTDRVMRLTTEVGDFVFTGQPPLSPDLADVTVIGLPSFLGGQDGSAIQFVETNGLRIDYGVVTAGGGAVAMVTYTIVEAELPTD